MAPAMRSPTSIVSWNKFPLPLCVANINKIMPARITINSNDVNTNGNEIPISVETIMITGSTNRAI